MEVAMEMQQPERIDYRGETNQHFTIEDTDAFLTLENKTVVLVNLPIFNIGRRIENNLVMNDPRVSRIHAQLRPMNGNYVLFDLGSTGGTFINGRSITELCLTGVLLSANGLPKYLTSCCIKRSKSASTGLAPSITYLSWISCGMGAVFTSAQSTVLPSR